MNTPEDLEKLLSECCEQLVDCCSLINEIPLEPKKDNIYKIGKALAELSELRSVLYDTYPNLKPPKWDLPPSERDYKEMYQVAVIQANEHLASANPKKAIETYESYIFIGPVKKYELLAKKAISEIHAKHNV